LSLLNVDDNDRVFSEIDQELEFYRHQTDKRDEKITEIVIKRFRERHPEIIDKNNQYAYKEKQDPYERQLAFERAYTAMRSLSRKHGPYDVVTYLRWKMHGRESRELARDIARFDPRELRTGDAVSMATDQLNTWVHSPSNFSSSVFCEMLDERQNLVLNRCDEIQRLSIPLLVSDALPRSFRGAVETSVTTDQNDEIFGSYRAYAALIQNLALFMVQHKRTSRSKVRVTVMPAPEDDIFCIEISCPGLDIPESLTQDGWYPGRQKVFE
jgi:hypothetical protein